MSQEEKVDDKIVYLIGAGASANALPLVTEMQERMELMQFFVAKVFALRKSEDFVNGVILKSFASPKVAPPKKLYESFLSGNKELISEIKKRRSVDTYANELFLKNDQESIKKLKKLKALMAVYLAFEEMWSDRNLLRILLSYGFRYIYPELFKTDQKDGSEVFLEDKKEVYNKVIRTLCQKPLLDYKKNLGNEGFAEDIEKILKNPVLAGIKDEDKLLNLLSFSGKNTLDQRYINFLIDISERGGKKGDVIFQEKVKIFSWNYDSQFFKASKELNFNLNFEESGLVYRFNGVASNKKTRKSFIDSNFDRLHIPHGDDETEKEELFIKKTLVPLLSLYDSFYKNPSQLSFAFERDELGAANTGLVKVEKYLKSGPVKTLVVIGYSFPFSNRFVDKNFLQAIVEKNIGNSEVKSFEIYIYTPKKEHYETTRSKIKTILKTISRAWSSEVSRFKESTNEDVLIFLDNEGQEKGEVRFNHYWDENNFFIPQDL
jgi:hypothetical protein